MTELNIVDPTYPEVEQCRFSNEGEQILHDFGVETQALEPPASWVPWITINNVIIMHPKSYSFIYHNYLILRYSF